MSNGKCVSRKRALEVITEEIQDYLPEEKWEEYECVVNRVRYEFAKKGGVKPKFHKGKSIHDWYTCGNCGFIIGGDVGANYCEHCGFAIKWDSPRCMTK